MPKTTQRTKEYVDEKGKFIINLSDIQLVEEYLANGYNASAAYRKIHPEIKESSLRASACRALKKENVERFLNMRRKEIYKALNLDAMRVAEELSTIAFAAKGDEDYTAANKIKALELLGKHFSMFTEKSQEKTEQTIHISIEE